MKIVGWASAFVVVSVFCKRVWLLFSSFIHPNIAYGPGISSGSLSARLSSGDQIWAVTSNYAPTLPEIIVALAVIAFGVTVFIVLIHKLLPKYKETHAAQVAELAQEAAAEHAGK
jgi:molybdopterin-containing oxidoreductase family membrane subunit